MPPNIHDDRTSTYKSFTNFIDVQCETQASKPFVRYYTKQGYNTLTYAQVNYLAINLACQWSKYKSVEVVSFISHHYVDYLIVMLALMKLRTTLSVISPRNSKAAIVNLLEKTHSKLLIVNYKYTPMAEDLKQLIDDVVVMDTLDIDLLLKEPLNPNYKELLDLDFSDNDMEKIALIVHSSGSTSLPKPIQLSNIYLFQLVRPFEIGISRDQSLKPLDNDDAFLSSTPLFHVFGICFVFTALTAGAKVVFMEKSPSSMQELYVALESNNCTVMTSPPIIYEQLIPYLSKKNDFSILKHLRVALYGGAPLKIEIGAWYHEHGVNVCNMYGSTEVGGPMLANLNPSSENWSSVTPLLKDSLGIPYCAFETNDDSDPAIKHLYIRKDSPNLATGVANRIDGGFNTNDLFKESVHFPGYYDYLGRRDDILILKNGEKTNPVAMESTIRQHPIVNQVAVLGHGRQCVSALIEINKDHAKGLSSKNIVLAVHEAVKEANKECPNYSTILPQMIKILPRDMTLPSTDKGTVMRKKAEATFIEFVDTLYNDFLQSSSIGRGSHNWSRKQTESFLIECVSKILQKPKSLFKDDYSKSLFDFDLDSLTSIQLRNSIAREFGNLPQNFVYQHQTISSMCDFLQNYQYEDSSVQIEKSYQETQTLAEKYIKKASTDFVAASNLFDKSKDKIVMLTGTTGSLGSFMLRNLLQDSSIKKVYAPVRGEQKTCKSRVIAAFRSRSLDTSILSTDRLEVLSIDFDDAFLGFGEEKYYQLKEEITIVQHCAWLLDFNMSIEHYDKECIAPFYNLLKFAYKQADPMHVHFVSSVSASARYGSSVPEEPLPLDSHISMPMGYAHSKFVVEILLGYLTSEKNFPCYVERLGQVCGDSLNGTWNVSEQYPLMFIGGGSFMKKMPALDTNVDWITVDHAATAITDIMLHTAYLPANNDESVYNIVNPRTIKWNDVLQFLKEAGMRFDVVPPSEWVQELAKNEDNPAYKLVGFYEQIFVNTFKMSTWETKKTIAVALSLSETPPINSVLFAKFLNRWQSLGFIELGSVRKNELIARLKAVYYHRNAVLESLLYWAGLTILYHLIDTFSKF